MGGEIGYGGSDNLNAPNKKTGFISSDPATANAAPHPERVRFEERLAEVRQTLLGVEEAVVALTRDPLFDAPIATADRDNLFNAQENVMLAYRHVEDARMRLGK